MIDSTSQNRYLWIRALFAYITCAAFVALQFMLQGSVSVMVPELRQSFGLDMSGIGLLSSSFFYPYVLMQMPMGLWVRRHGVRQVQFFSGCLLSVSCVIYLTAGDVSQALAGRLLMGVASASGVVSLLEVISLSYTVRWFAFLAGLMDVVIMLGAASGEYLIPRGMVVIGWEGVLIIAAVFAFLIALAALCCLPRRQTEYTVSQTAVTPSWRYV